jgi:hypothetical protein
MQLEAYEDPRLKEQRLQAKAIREGRMSPIGGEVVDPAELLTAGYDNDSKQAYIAQLLRGGQEGIYAPMPEGRMMGDVYAAPNWADSLAGAAQRVVGGYQMGQARKQQRKLDRALEKAALKEQQAAEAAARAAEKRQQFEDERDAKKEAAKAAQALAQEQGRNLRAAQSNATRLAAAAASAAKGENKRTMATFHNPDSPESVLNFNRDSAGNFYDLDGNQVPGEFVKTLTPYTASQTGSVAKARAAADKTASENTTRLLDADQATMTILDPNLRTATGHPLDPEMYASRYGAPGYENAQATATRAQAVTMDAVAPTLAKLGVNPTDRDLREAFKTAPGIGTQPEVWVDWYENTYMPAMDAALTRDNPESRDAVMAEMMHAVEQAKQVQKKKPEGTANSAGWSIRTD